MSLRWADSGQAEAVVQLGTRVECRRISRVSIRFSSKSMLDRSRLKMTRIGLLLIEPAARFFFFAELLIAVQISLRRLILAASADGAERFRMKVS